MIVSIGLTIRGVGPAGLPTPPIRSRRLISLYQEEKGQF
jgi:hypothetical protein